MLARPPDVPPSSNTRFKSCCCEYIHFSRCSFRASPLQNAGPTQETCMVTTTKIYSFKRDIWTPYPCGWNFSPARSAARSEAFGWNDLTRAIPAQSNGLLQQKPNIRESVDRVGYELCSFRSNGTNIGKGVLELLLRWPEFWHFLNLRLHLADPLRPLLYTNSITGNEKYTISCTDVFNGR